MMTPGGTPLDVSAEQEARDLLGRMDIDATQFTSGDLVELANLIAGRTPAGQRPSGGPTWEDAEALRRIAGRKMAFHWTFAERDKLLEISSRIAASRPAPAPQRVTSDELREAFWAAKRQVFHEMDEASKRGELRSNSEMPSWPRYVAAETALLASPPITQPPTQDALQDTARLDWLEANKGDGNGGWQVVPFGNGWPLHVMTRGPYHSLRAAIDAAMQPDSEKAP